MQQEEIQPRFHAPARSAELSPCLAAEAENKPEVGSAMRCDEDQGGSAEELQRLEEAAAAAQNHHRQWWETLGPSHPAFGGMVPDEWFDQDVPRYVAGPELYRRPLYPTVPVVPAADTQCRSPLASG